MTHRQIPFNKSYIAGRELYYIAQAVANGDLKGDGPFTKRCARWFEERMDIPACLLTHSCTGALELSAMLLNLEQDDEVILPSFTFTSTANAFLLRGCKLVFADIDPETLNICPKEIERRITDKTKAICVVHYAGVACDMDAIMALSEKYSIPVVEDAAHAVIAKYKGKYLGTFGALGTFSFHETKNYSSGEGGALLINDPKLKNRAEILREKGTNRSQFFRGEVDKYSWVDIGSSFLPSEIISAFLYGQLEHADSINDERLRLWNMYYQRLTPLQEQGLLRLPIVPEGCEHNAHMFYILIPDPETKEALRKYMNERGCSAVFHYLPLHAAIMGKRLGNQEHLPVTERIAETLLRLPLYCGLEDCDVDQICSTLEAFMLEKSLQKVSGA
ncbi:MAG: dTDP-4-amino-4,6-dideoxygalactose transaminase [Bdellovibrionales bacterium]|nr:dTDP-4-amino-4,6-dideoxygalactose transaminase [Bdellovibrionales bacterium]